MKPHSRTRSSTCCLIRLTGAGLQYLRLEAGNGYNYGFTGFTIQPTSPGNSSSTPSYSWDGSADDLVLDCAGGLNREAPAGSTSTHGAPRPT